METFEAITSRKSTRDYPDEQITKPQLKKIILAAQAAPVAMGKYKDFHLTFIQNQKKIEKLESFIDKQPYYGAPTVVIISALQSKKGQVNFEDSLGAGIIAENIALEATDLGLATCDILGAIVMGLNKNNGLIKEIGVPDGFRPYLSVVLGNKKNKYEQRNIPDNRIPLNFVH